MLEIFLMCEAATGRPAPGIAGEMAGTWVAGRLAALRYSYAIVRAARAAAPRGEPHAGRASNGRSEAANASSDLPILVPKQDSTAGCRRAFAVECPWGKPLRVGFSKFVIKMAAGDVVFLSATQLCRLWLSAFVFRWQPRSVSGLLALPPVRVHQQTGSETGSETRMPAKTREIRISNLTPRPNHVRQDT